MKLLIADVCNLNTLQVNIIYDFIILHLGKILIKNQPKGNKTITTSCFNSIINLIKIIHAHVNKLKNCKHIQEKTRQYWKSYVLVLCNCNYNTLQYVLKLQRMLFTYSPCYFFLVELFIYVYK